MTNDIGKGIEISSKIPANAFLGAHRKDRHAPFFPLSFEAAGTKSSMPMVGGGANLVSEKVPKVLSRQCVGDIRRFIETGCGLYDSLRARGGGDLSYTYIPFAESATAVARNMSDDLKATTKVAQ